MDKKMSDALSVTFNGNVTFQGPMFDIHDNEKVVINNVNLLRKLVLMTAVKMPITRPNSMAMEMDTAANNEANQPETAVTTGFKALRKAWMQMTRNGFKPLARAVRT